MKRRTLFGAGAAAILGGGILGLALGAGPMDSEKPNSPGYQEDSRIVYERENVLLTIKPDVVEQPEEITVEIQHTGNTGSIFLGCNIAWAVQKYVEGEWEHVAWTGSRYVDLCDTRIQPGQSKIETVQLSIPEMKDDPEITDIAVDELSPGKYRFVLLGEKPFVAVNFDVPGPD